MTTASWILAALFAAAALLGPLGAHAQTQFETLLCGQRASVIGRLGEKYREAPVAIGVTSTGSMVELLTTGDGTTWTIIVSNPNGTSCLIAAGEGWRALRFNITAADPRV
jgi:hypothetical protein